MHESAWDPSVRTPAHRPTTPDYHTAASSFDAEWNLKWADGSVEIKAEWRRLLGSTERLLRDSGPVVIEIGRFVAEWRSLLMRLYEALDQAGVSQRLTDGMARLRSLITRMNSQVLQ